MFVALMTAKRKMEGKVGRRKKTEEGKREFE